VAIQTAINGKKTWHHIKAPFNGWSACYFSASYFDSRSLRNCLVQLLNSSYIVGPLWSIDRSFSLNRIKRNGLDHRLQFPSIYSTQCMQSLDAVSSKKIYGQQAATLWSFLKLPMCVIASWDLGIYSMVVWSFLRSVLFDGNVFFASAESLMRLQKSLNPTIVCCHSRN